MQRRYFVRFVLTFSKGTIVANTAEPGCCGSNIEQKISLTDTAQFPGANLKAYVTFICRDATQHVHAHCTVPT